VNVEREPKRYSLEGADKGRCRGCGVLIWWVMTEHGRKMPVNQDGTTHYATCPNADEFRRKGGRAG
jgi:hypothetical protein